MGFLKSLFAPQQPKETKTDAQVSADKQRVAFETLKDSGVRAIKINEYKLAIGYLCKALELRPDDREAKALLAEAYLSAGEMADALAMLRPMADENPGNVNVWLSIARAELELREWDGLLDASAKAETLAATNPIVFYYEGMAYSGMEDYDSAISKFTKAISLADSYTDAYIMRAKAYASQEKFDEAEKDVDFMIAHDMADDYVYMLKGKLRRAHEDYEGALAAYRKARELNPFNVEAYISEGETCELRGDNAGAMDVYNEALANMPDSAEVLRVRAALEKKTGAEAAAEDDLHKADAATPQGGAQDGGGEFSQMQNRVEDNARRSNPFGF